MPRKKPVSPRINLQVEVPATMVVALDLLASRANAGRGIARSQLVRAVLAEYVELKLGPDLRKAIVAWDKHGGDLMAQFFKTAMPHIPAETIRADAGSTEDPNYNPNPLDENDVLHEIEAAEAERRQESPTQVSKSENGGWKEGTEQLPAAETLAEGFADEHDVPPPAPTESAYLQEDPARADIPLPRHFQVRSDYESPNPPPSTKEEKPVELSNRPFQSFDP